MESTAPPIVVGRVRKPHGLKGELAIFPLTDDPEAVFTGGRVLRLLNLGGDQVGSVTIAAGRGYHRELLLKLRDHGSRESVEGYRQLFVAVGRDELPPLEDGQVYIQELAGFAVVDEAGTPLGIVSDVYDLPAGPVIEVQGEKREFLLPFRGEYIRETDRDGRRLTVTIPDGLLD